MENIFYELEKSNFTSNENCKKSLLIFFDKFKKLKPSKEYQIYMHHYSYISSLFEMKKGFIENNYQVVVNGIGTLNHQEDILQPRIYYCIIDLFNNYLGSDIDVQ